jgi:hypothetical protein
MIAISADLEKNSDVNHEIKDENQVMARGGSGQRM